MSTVRRITRSGGVYAVRVPTPTGYEVLRHVREGGPLIERHLGLSQLLERHEQAADAGSLSRQSAPKVVAASLLVAANG